jgi:hypothetical protein
VEILRKLLLTSGLQYMGTDDYSSVAVASIIANVFLMLHAQLKPSKRLSDHWLQLFSLLLISCNLMMATLMALQEANAQQGNTTSLDSVIFSVIVMLVNMGFVVYVGGQCGCYDAIS